MFGSSILRSSSVLSLAAFTPQTPICVDLDGTLLQGNALHMLLKKALRMNLVSLSWFQSMRFPALKYKIAEQCIEHGLLAPSELPYYIPLLHQLNTWKSCAVPIFLVTGAPSPIAHAIAHHLELFQDVYASSAHINLVGARKAHHLLRYFGSKGFTYVGDSWRDLAVWAHAQTMITVTSSSCLLRMHLARQKTPLLIL
jgi:phosphoserine phosphatase